MRMLLFSLLACSPEQGSDVPASTLAPVHVEQRAAHDCTSTAPGLVETHVQPWGNTPSGYGLAVADFNLDLQPGELVGIIGPNGAGKTTVFNLITGVYRASEG
ncbi:MAG TPA: ATP-binding cassette domain-containing protein, partial [Myxococcota bacterium]|nr:ATP-binding cassette domain-containing protein [Myxococcota bacterium]